MPEDAQVRPLEWKYAAVRRYQARKGAVHSVAFSPQGNQLAAGGGHDFFVVRDPATTAEAVVHAEAGAVDVIAFSPDGTLLATAGARRVSVRKAGKGTTLWTRTSGGSTLKTLAFAGGLLLGADEAGRIFAWDSSTGAGRPSVPMPGVGGAQGMAFRGDGAILAASGKDRSIRRWDVPRGRPVGVPLQMHKEGVVSLALSLDGRHLASAGWDPAVLLWDLSASETRVERLTGHAGPYSSLTFDPGSHLLSAGTADGKVLLWGLGNRPGLGESLPRSGGTAHDAAVAAVAFLPDALTLASADEEGDLMLWDTKRRETAAGPWPGGDHALRMAFSPDGRLLATLASSGITLREAETGHGLGAPLEGASGTSFSSVAVGDDGFVAGGAEDGTLTLWAQGGRNTGEPFVPTPVCSEAIESVALSPDRRRLAVGACKAVYLCDVTAHRCDDRHLFSFASPVRSLAFDPAGGTLAAGAADGRFLIWDVSGRRVLAAPPSEHEEPISSLAFSPDGALLARGDGVGRVSLWDVKRRRDVGEFLRVHQGEIKSLAFDRGMRFLASGGGDNSVVLWDIDPVSWRKRACGIANRNLTCDEWRESLGERPYRPACPQLPYPGCPHSEAALRPSLQRIATERDK